MDFDKIIDRRGTYCTQWDYVKDRFGKDNLLPFTISDMDFECPKEITDALIKRVNHKIFGYSRWNNDDFKNSIENWYKKRFNFQIDKESIIYSPSVIYSVSKLIEMKSQKGDYILVNTPAYDGFFKVITGNQRVVLTSPLKKSSEKYEIDFEDFEEKCKESKIFIFCSPHNPVGRVWNKEEIHNIISICKKYNVFIISDEIHMDIVYEKKHIPILSVYKDYNKNIALCTSASKTFNISSLGVTYILITNKKDKDEFLNILKNKDALSSPPILGIIATMEGYNKCEYFVDELVKYVKNNINYIIDYIKENKLKLKCYIPEASYFAWIDFFKLGLSDEEFQKYLINIGEVAIMPGTIYGIDGTSYLRINAACSFKKIKECMIRIEKTVKYIKDNNIIKNE